MNGKQDLDYRSALRTAIIRTIVRQSIQHEPGGAKTARIPIVEAAYAAIEAIAELAADMDVPDLGSDASRAGQSIAQIFAAARATKRQVGADEVAGADHHPG